MGRNEEGNGEVFGVAWGRQANDSNAKTEIKLVSEPHCHNVPVRVVIHDDDDEKHARSGSTLMPEIPRPEKILIAMLLLSGDTSRPLEYEDIVVQAWKLFPEDFGLRKYVREYPDASDIHKPLYGPLKERGFVLSGNKQAKGNKMFKLTERGVAYAQQLEKVRQGLQSFEQLGSPAATPDRLSRDKEAELKRIAETDAFQLFAAGQREKILDTDFYSYLSATVRTERREFIGRLETVGEAVVAGERLGTNEKHKIAAELHRFVCEKFAQIIERKKGMA